MKLMRSARRSRSLPHVCSPPHPPLDLAPIPSRSLSAPAGGMSLAWRIGLDSYPSAYPLRARVGSGSDERAGGRSAGALPWSLDETLTFLTAARKDPLYAAFAFAIALGFRRGEIVGCQT